jgi:hypothetical protein
MKTFCITPLIIPSMLQVHDAKDILTKSIQVIN